MANKQDDEKNKPVHFKKNDVQEDDEEGGGEVGTLGEESWVHILESLGQDTRAMSIAEIKAMIRNVTDNNKTSNIYSIKSGEKVKSVARKQQDPDGRTYKVSADQSGFAASDEVVPDSAKDKRSEKENKNTPQGPVIGPKPKPPGM